MAQLKKRRRLGAWDLRLVANCPALNPHRFRRSPHAPDLKPQARHGESPAETFAHARRGIALIELAIVLPLLLAITFGVMEYGWMFLKASQIANAARQGARVGARPDANTATVNAAIASAMTAAGIPAGAYSGGVTLTPANPATLASGEQFKVRISVPYANIDLGLPLIPTPTNLTSEVTMAREGP